MGKYIGAESTCVKLRQRVFKMKRYGSNKKLKNNFVPLRANKSGAEGFLVGELFLLFRVEAKHVAIKTEEELTFA